MLLLKQIQDYARIQRAAARAHHQSVYGGEAHCTGHAFPIVHGAQACPIAQMGQNRPAGRSRRIDFQQLRHDVLI